MRFSYLVLASVLLASNAGCSSDESSSTPERSKEYLCASAGGYCAANFPFTCQGGEPATDDELKTACGKSMGDDPRDVACCLPIANPDTGTTDAGADGDADESSETGDATADGSDGETATDAASDTSEVGDSVTDASDAG